LLYRRSSNVTPFAPAEEEPTVGVAVSESAADTPGELTPLDLAKRAVAPLSDAEWAELVCWREAGCPEG
jgi:hypothetical protein